MPNLYTRLVEYVQHHCLGWYCSICIIIFSAIYHCRFSTFPSPVRLRSETRILLMKLKFITCRIHITWNTFNQNLPRRISSPTLTLFLLYVVIRCQSALLCRSSILIHLYFFLQKPQDPYWKKGLISLKNTLQVQSRGWFRFFFHFMFSSWKK